MTTYDAVIALYILFWVLRVYGCIRRGRQPLLRGPEWFFDVHVQPGFYEGDGKKILHRYWLRMLVPFAVDIPLAIAIFLSGRIWLLNLLIVFLSALIHLNHVFSVHDAERQARAFATEASARPVKTMALSLWPRRLGDYTNWNVEAAIITAHTLAGFWLVRYFLTAPQHASARVVFAAPVFLLYVQFGMLFIKQMIVRWRIPLPQSGAAELIEAREEARRFYLQVCDWGRAILTAAFLFSPVKLTAAPANANRIATMWLVALIATAVVAISWVEIGRKQLLASALRGDPATLPDLAGHGAIAGALLCYQPDVPMLIVKGARGYSLNLANHLAQIAAVYLAGLVALFAMLPMPR